MERNELLDQYDRFIDQVRTEIKDLYWLYNFFFVVNSALIGSVFIGRLVHHYLAYAELSGIFLSVYWYVIIRKQWMWRNDWVKRIQGIERELGYENPMLMWKSQHPDKQFFRDYVFGKRGLWRWLFILPIAFTVRWTVMFLRHLGI